MYFTTKQEFQDFQSSGDYTPHFNSIDNEVVTEDLDGCPKCKSKLCYEGYKGGGEYWAFAVCTNNDCDYAQDF